MSRIIKVDSKFIEEAEHPNLEELRKRDKMFEEWYRKYPDMKHRSKTLRKALQDSLSLEIPDIDLI